MPISRRAKILIASTLIIYASVCGLLVLNERSMVYVPYPGATTPQAAHLDHYVAESFTAVDGATIPYWHHSESSDAPILMYFHGNGGGLHSFTPALDVLARQGVDVVAMEYRGYPGAPPHPSETAIVSDAVAMFDMLKSRYPNRPIAVWGYSLGSGVATQLAAKRHVDALVLEAPFTSTADVADGIFPLIPVYLLMRDQYRSKDAIASIHTPLFIMHGNRDRIIPEPMGEALFAAAQQPKTMKVYGGVGHLDLIRTSAYADAFVFLRHSGVIQKP